MEITLKTSKSLAKIKSAGAELSSLIFGGKELMWCADPEFWGKSSPVLFPVIGNLRGGRTRIGSSEYFIGKHGFARGNEFTAKQNSDNTAIFVFSDSPQTRSCFPFDFDFTMHYTLTDERLEILYEVTNNSDAPMPFCIGAHPAFACGSVDGCRLVFDEKETVNSPVMNTKTRLFQNEKRIWRLKNSDTYELSYSLFDNDVNYFDNLLSHGVNLLEPDGHGVRVCWEGFSTLGVWTPAGKKAPFICIEPWCGADDFDDENGNFEDKRGVQTVLPKSSAYYIMTIEKV